MKKKKISKFLAVAATTTMAVTPLGEAGNVLASPTTESDVASTIQSPQQTKVSKFNLFTQPDMLENYNEKFGVDRTKVEAVANGGESQMAWDNVELKNIFDGKLNTYWASDTPNNTRFKNDVTFKFDEVKTLDRIVYAPQQDGKGSGYLLEFEILGKSSENGDFVKVAEGAHTPKNLNEAIEIKFQPTNFKELKVVFKNVKSHWATASEIMFFKQDTVYEKVSSIFKGEDYIAVNEAYDLEALKALEEEIVGHPLQENFQKIIHDAKSILTVKDVEQVEAETKKFTHFDHADYKNQFMVPRNEIESFKNNGGHYSVAELKNAFDGNTATYWETNKANSTNFNNEVEIAFTKLTEINRIVYGARESDRKGFITHFEIWVSPTSQGDNFELVSTGRHNKVAGLVEAKFNAVEAKRVKLVAKQSDQNWASLSELAFFKQDQDLDRVESMFVDGTQSELTAGYSTVKEIEALEAEVKDHVLYEPSMKADLELAKKLAVKEIDVEGTIFTAEQVGDRRAYAKNVLRTDIGSNLQPTGLAALAGEQLTVYVDPNGSLQMPSLVFAQTEGSWSSWNRSVQLSPGKNVITVPTVHQDGKYHYNVTPGGPIYIVNPYTKEQQGGEAPTIRIEGADRIPFMTPEKSSEQFKKELAAYKAKVDADIKANPAVANRQVLDVVEMVSEHVIYTGRASNAYAAYFKENATDPAATLKGYDIWMDQTFKFHGLDGREGHDPSVIRENIRIMQPLGFMYAYTDHTGIQPAQEGLMFGDFSKNYPGWGLNHEIGHRIDLTAREFSEVTNNMTSMGMSIVAGNMDNRIPYEGIIYKHVINETGYDWNSQGNLAAKLGLYWQLELAHKGYWAELESIYREAKLGVGSTDYKQQHLIQYSSDVLGLDLVEYFARHGIFANDETKNYTSKHPKLAKKIWYLNNSTYHYEGNGFSQNVDVAIDVLANTGAKTDNLSFSINDENKDDLLGYEIIQNDKVIGFTSNGSFVVTNVGHSQANEYQIVAYDKKLNASKPFTVSSFKPTISAEENLVLKLNQKDFNPLDYVKAFDSTGNDITNKVVVESSNVSLQQKGKYRITYKVTDRNATETKTINVTVTSDYTYLSDMKEVSKKVGWSVLTKDKALQDGKKITLLRNNIPIEYDKGLAAHANSEVVYDIKDKGYHYLESYIGIDHSMKGTPANARFEVWIDGVKQYHSGNFTAGTNGAFIKIDVKDAKTVTLVTNSNGADASDHTVWADAKFTKDSSKPVISITSAATKVGEPIDIIGNYTATDAEDGDLTALVNVTGTEAVDFNQAGDYTLTYTVTDSDDNEVTATRTISVVDMKNSKYLSSYNWESENHSYSAPIKDKATSGKELRLTGENGEVIPYEKGIGAHSNSTIVYDLTDKKAAYFTSYIGVDRQMHNTIGSIEFKVIVDGVEKYTSGVMKSTDQQKYVEVDLTGAKELKLVVTDGGNGNGSDHATWGDAKLHYANEQSIADINNGIDNNTSGSDGSGNGTSSDSGNTGTSNDSPDSGNTGTSNNSPDSGNTGTSNDSSDSGNTGTSNNSPDSGNTGTSNDSSDSGNTGTSNDSSGSGNTGTSNDNSDSGNTGTSNDSSDSGNTGTSNNSPDSGNTGTSNDSSDSSNTGTSNDSSDSGNTGTSNDSSDSGNTGTSNDSSGSGNTGTSNKPNAPESSENKVKIDLEGLDEKLKEKIDSLVIEITSKLPNGFTDGFFLSFAGDKNDINSIESVTVNKDGLFITVDNTLVRVTDPLPDTVTDFANARIVRVVDDKVSTVIHHSESNGLKITSSNLQNLFVTSRVLEPFSDVDKTDWYSKDVEDIFNYAITQGTTDTTYSPNDSITRGQFATTIARALEITHRDKYDAYKLSDVEGKWYANDVQMLVDLGIITGYEDGTFGGENKLSRQQAAAMVARMLKYMNVDTTTKGNVAFGDTDNISDYAKEAVQFLAANGVLISGKDTNFNPHNNLTRAQMAKVLMQSLQLSNKLRTNR